MQVVLSTVSAVTFLHLVYLYLPPPLPLHRPLQPDSVHSTGCSMWVVHTTAVLSTPHLSLLLLLQWEELCALNQEADN